MPNAPLVWQPRKFAPGQRSELRTVDIETGETHLVFSTDQIIEAPNWTPDGRDLIFNGDNNLYRVPADGSAGPEQIDLGGLPVNDDHMISRDGAWLYLTAYDRALHIAPIGGGAPRRFTKENPDLIPFLHGVSPDGEEVAYVGMRRDGEQIFFNIFTVPVSGGPDRKLTDLAAHDDGPEYSPGGEWIYFNSQRNEDTPQQSQIFRMRRDGSGVEQAVKDGRNNWFPHPSPDGRLVSYISYAPDTIGRPHETEVEIRVAGMDGSDPRCVVRLYGGRGTINVNSWAPDSRRLAYVAYPVGAA